MNTVKRIAFLGLGRMGSPMAARLVHKGFDVKVFDLRRDVAEEFVAAHGGTLSTSLADAVREADAVIAMLPDDAAVRGAMLGTEGVAQHLSRGSIAIDMGTSSPGSTVSIAHELHGRGLAFIDAPVMGGVRFAQDGTLDIMVGGEAASIERCTSLFGALGRKAWQCGASGSGHALKAIANFINAATLTTLAEGMAAGRKFGLDGPFLAEALTAMCTGRQHPLEKKIIPQVMTRAFASGMAIALIAKDVGIAVELAHGVGARAPIAEQTLALWQEAAARYGATVDQTVVVRLWEDAAGVTIE